MKQEGVLESRPAQVVARLKVSNDFSTLHDAEAVIEATTESVAIKKQVLADIESAVSRTALIGTNTSAIPVSFLQQGLRHPGRLLGTHWAEPAHITRFMEIICGERTEPRYAQRALALTRRWGKEPSLVRRDIRGFITNRCFYALLREAFHLVESGYATVADIDRSLRNDLGYWITFAGPFRFMDITGVPAYGVVMRDLWPDLDCAKKVSPLMKKLLKSGARGVSNARGFYRYTPREAKRWEKLFLKFSYEIRALAQRYPENIGQARPKRRMSGKLLAT
jgi:3-hydroxybutyryl-CoA dehydrogenase